MSHPAPNPADDPLAGLNPEDLLKQGLPGNGSNLPTEVPDTSGRFTPPGVEELNALLPQFEVLELLGRGGMGAVYKARQNALDRLIAIKILPPQVGRDPAFAERFSREAKALAKLNHPHIVSVHDAGCVNLPHSEDKLYYFVMEFVDGVSLRQLIHDGKLPPEEALAVVPQVCEALQYAHDVGIVHRDIKPDNILLDQRGRVKIADFGLAKLLDQNIPDVTLTGTNQVMGTLRYMAPEQMSGVKAIDHRADIYSLGVVFYEMLTGEVPMGRFAPPSKKVQIDIRLDEVVLRALEQDPQQRYQHAREIKTDVETVFASQAFASAPTVAMKRVPDSLVFRRWTPILIAIWLGWTALFAALHWGYLSGAKWYFDEELPYKYLTAAVTQSSWMLMGILTYWWYLLAKTSDAPRSLSDFWRTLQTPDQRAIGIWIPAAIYFSLSVIAMIVASVFGNDTVQATTMLISWVALPPLVMTSCLWAYGLPKRQSSH